MRSFTMTTRRLTTIGSATAVATVVGALLLAGPTAQAAPIGGCSKGNCGSISHSNGTTTITGTSHQQSGIVIFCSGGGLFASGVNGTSSGSFSSGGCGTGTGGPPEEM